MLSEEKGAGKEFAKSFVKFSLLILLVIFGAVYGVIFIFFTFLPQFIFLAPFIILPIVFFFIIWIYRSKTFVDYQRSAVRFWAKGSLKEMYKEQAKFYKEFMREELKKELREELKGELRKELSQEK